MRVFFLTICTTLVLFLHAPFFAYSQSPVSLDQALGNGVRYLSDRIPRGTRVAVLAVKADNPEIGDFTLRKISTALVNGNWFTVVERNETALDSLSREMNYQLSGGVSDDTSLSIGRQLGAQVIISGILTGSGAGSGQNWRLELKALDVESAQIAGQWSAEHIRPDPAWASLASSRSATLSFAGDIPAGRDRQTIIDGLRNAMETWKTQLEPDENAVSAYTFIFTVYRSELAPTPPANMAMLQAEVEIAFTRNGRIMCKTGPFTVRETTDALIARRIAEQLRGDQVFFSKVNEAIK